MEREIFLIYWDNLQVKQLRDTKNKAIEILSTKFQLLFHYEYNDFEHELEVTRNIRSPHADKSPL